MGAKGTSLHLAWEGSMNGLHPEILNEPQSALLSVLGPWASAKGFYLGGGTAVALYLGHRRSVDFDWFIGESIQDPLLLAGQLRECDPRLEGVQVAPGTLHAVIQGVRISFFAYPYPVIGEPTAWPEYSVGLASLDDLACMKLAAIAQRGSRKDFVDLHAIALNHKPIQVLLALYRRKYRTEDIAHILVGLTYFDDAEEEPMPIMLGGPSWDEVKRQFKVWTKALAG